MIPGKTPPAAQKNANLSGQNLSDKKQTGPLKKRRAGVDLTKGEVTAIRAGRKKLRAELWKKGIRSRKEFELTASSLGLYFDKNRFWGVLLWFFHGRGLWALLGALTMLLLSLFLFSLVSQMKGHFTINLDAGMFREGFTLSQTRDFASPTTRLLAEPSEDVPCVSVVDIAEDVHTVDGKYEGESYFAYTFYLRNEGESIVDYEWKLSINSESKSLSDAVWFMVFEDDEMRMFAKGTADGNTEALPAFGDDSRGYRERPFVEYAKEPESLYGAVRVKDGSMFYRLTPERFVSDTLVADGLMTQVEPMEVHKYTIVIWLEGDDPDCTDDKIIGHLGVDMDYRLISGATQEEDSSWWSVIWRNLRFWEN